MYGESQYWQSELLRDHSRQSQRDREDLLRTYDARAKSTRESLIKGYQLAQRELGQPVRKQQLEKLTKWSDERFRQQRGRLSEAYDRYSAYRQELIGRGLHQWKFHDETVDRVLQDLNVRNADEGYGLPYEKKMALLGQHEVALTPEMSTYVQKYEQEKARRASRELSGRMRVSEAHYSNAESQVVERFARNSEGEVDYSAVIDLCPFARVYGLERGEEELKKYVSQHGLRNARWAGRELKKKQPSQPYGVPIFRPQDSFGPVVRPPQATFGPVVPTPMPTVQMLPVMPG